MSTPSSSTLTVTVNSQNPDCGPRDIAAENHRCLVPECDQAFQTVFVLSKHVYAAHCPRRWTKAKPKDMFNCIQGLVRRVLGCEMPWDSVFRHLPVEKERYHLVANYEAVNIRQLAHFSYHQKLATKFKRSKRVTKVLPPIHPAVLIHWTWIMRLLRKADAQTRTWFSACLDPPAARSVYV